ncbi:UPF0575 protein C19orf67 homolog [Scleropages formosus]|uniref:Si:ch211-214c7.5 n=1 Tax=Scleropages formosus TaxID=113540 RepID=A0A8C9RFR4_SCLFO|nr:UPF0575 protein C19orf67 homolog [Scleropages formosus]XP_018617158.1 UPF0575 protein C19orf67 homolog [Scleropages formosus]XP_018617159.1 UPF0575 protein C19orf67 homolog [Scleropages formosus]
MAEETRTEELSVHDSSAIAEEKETRDTTDQQVPGTPRPGSLSESVVPDFLTSGESDSSGQSNLGFLLKYSDFIMVEDRLEFVERVFRCLMNQAVELQAHLICSHPCFPKEAFVHVVPAFLHRCHPYFTYLEFRARSYWPSHRSIPTCIRNRLLELTQKLCIQLERLIVMYASFDILSLDESDPCGFSHFYIGQCLMGPFKVSMFRYCQPSSFLADDEEGLNGFYKCMRWNVERYKEYLEEMDANKKKVEDEEKMDRREPDYYFMCYKDVPWLKAQKWCKEQGNQEIPLGGTVRLWSLGQWVQADPDPTNEDILDWVLCKRPKGLFKLLRCLGPNEPSVSEATDYLLGVLFLHMCMKEHLTHCEFYG